MYIHSLLGLSSPAEQICYPQTEASRIRDEYFWCRACDTYVLCAPQSTQIPSDCTQLCIDCSCATSFDHVITPLGEVCEIAWRRVPYQTLLAGWFCQSSGCLAWKVGVINFIAASHRAKQVEGGGIERLPYIMAEAVLSSCLGAFEPASSPGPWMRSQNSGKEGGRRRWRAFYTRENSCWQKRQSLRKKEPGQL